MSDPSYTRRLTWWIKAMPAWPLPSEHPNRDYLEILKDHSQALSEWERRKPVDDAEAKCH